MQSIPNLSLTTCRDLETSRVEGLISTIIINATNAPQCLNGFESISQATGILPLNLVQLAFLIKPCDLLKLPRVTKEKNNTLKMHGLALGCRHRMPVQKRELSVISVKQKLLHK